MNAEEFTSIVLQLERTLQSISTRPRNSDAAERDLSSLVRLWRALDRHRQEMEAAEAKKPEAPTLVGVRDFATRRVLEHIEKRLGEIADRQDRHLKLFHEMPVAG